MDDVFKAKLFLVFGGYPGTLVLAVILIGLAMMWLREANRKRGASETAHRVTLLFAAAMAAGLLDLLRGLGVAPLPNLPPNITNVYLPSADWYLTRALITFAACAAFGVAEWHAHRFLRRFFREPNGAGALAVSERNHSPGLAANDALNGTSAGTTA